MRKLAVLGLFSLTVALTGCKDEKLNKSISTAEVTFTKEAELLLLKPTGDTIQQLDIEIADSDYERETGLMYRDSMKNNQGMLFVFENEKPRYFYMKNTHIPLDIIYLDANKTIVNIIENAEANNESSLPSQKPAKYVLEIKAGLSNEWNLESGDKITYVSK